MLNKEPLVSAGVENDMYEDDIYQQILDLHMGDESSSNSDKMVPKKLTIHNHRYIKSEADADSCLYRRPNIYDTVSYNIERQLTPIEQQHEIAINAYQKWKSENNYTPNNNMLLIKAYQDEIRKLRLRVHDLELAVKESPKINLKRMNNLFQIKFNSLNKKNKCLSILIKKEISKIKHDLLKIKKERKEKKEKNLALETQVIEITDNLSKLRDDLEKEKHSNYLHIMNEYNSSTPSLTSISSSNEIEYPPENIIIQNLIRTQIEFYFSDYNLKRDKRLLDQLCCDKIGYLKIDKVMNLSRVRQLSNHENQIIDAVKTSKFLCLSSDNEWVGRPKFKKPTEKQFPFRRTVFVFGLPLNSTQDYIKEMLSPFGKLSKVKFDHGPDTLDRCVAQKMLETQKVYKFMERIKGGNIIEYNYCKTEIVGGSKEYKCNICEKKKLCIEAFYECNNYTKIICLQCAAFKAEKNLNNLMDSNERIKNHLLGIKPRNSNNTKTALAVFTSQRQASKCVYVRSRIGYDGCFTTHYHHYSKLKKEIALSKSQRPINIQTIPNNKLDEINRLPFIQAINEDKIYNKPIINNIPLSIESIPMYTKNANAAHTAPVYGSNKMYITKFNNYNKMKNNNNDDDEFKEYKDPELTDHESYQQ